MMGPRFRGDDSVGGNARVNSKNASVGGDDRVGSDDRVSGDDAHGSRFCEDNLAFED